MCSYSGINSVLCLYWYNTWYTLKTQITIVRFQAQVSSRQQIYKTCMQIASNQKYHCNYLQNTAYVKIHRAVHCVTTFTTITVFIYLFPPNFKNGSGKRTFRYRGAVSWNKLPAACKNPIPLTANQFKCALKFHC